MSATIIISAIAIGVSLGSAVSVVMLAMPWRKM
jgi:hypothetical protein